MKHKNKTKFNVMFSAGQYRSTDGGYEMFENIIFSHLNLPEIFLFIYKNHFQAIKNKKVVLNH